MPPKILISDTNIWIDLHRCTLLETVFKLPHQFVTTEFVWRELRKPPGHQAKLDVRDVNWILDELEFHPVLSPVELASALASMLDAGAGLPDEECDKRLTKWRKG